MESLSLWNDYGENLCLYKNKDKQNKEIFNFQK